MRGVLTVLMLLMVAWSLPVTSADSYVVPTTQRYQIDEHSYCQQVLNNHATGQSILVPTKSEGEWINQATSFISATPPGITFSECLQAASLRFNGDVDQAYLQRNPGSSSDRKVWTWSGWVKRMKTGVHDHIFTAGPNSDDQERIFIDNTDMLRYQLTIGNTNRAYKRTTRLFRDPSAWYHIVVARDDTTARIWINGEENTSWDTNSNPGGYNSYYNSAQKHRVGGWVQGTTHFFDGYISNVHFVDGLALEASDFGEYDATTLQWKPKAYSGAYGTNGFHLTFSRTGDLGHDSSGNGNDYTPTNLTTTPGSDYDPMYDYIDRRTIADNLAGVSPLGNYVTMNPLDPTANAFSNGALDVNGSGSTGSNIGYTQSSIPFPSSGKWLVELTMNNNSSGTPYLGIHEGKLSDLSGPSPFNTADNWYVRPYAVNSKWILSPGGSEYTPNNSINYANGHTIRLALDADNGYLWFGVHNGASTVWLANSSGDSGDPAAGTNPTVTGLTNGPYYVSHVGVNGANITANFGQRPFVDDVPSGFTGLNTYSLPTPAIITPTAYFKAVTYTGDGGAWRQVGVPSQGGGGATIGNSLRFDSADNTYLSRTFGSSGNLKTWTWSGWVKQTNLAGGTTVMFGARNGTPQTHIFATGGKLRVFSDNASGVNIADVITTAPVLRDVSAWHHVVVAFDAGNGTAADRVKIHVDGQQAALTTSTAVNNTNHSINANMEHNFGREPSVGGSYFNGYLSDVHFIDGSALTPDDFGQYNAQGVWVPKTYSGAYGTNGFHLDFANSADIGNDAAGSNDWTPTNLASTDVVADTVTSNFPTLNPLDVGTNVILAEGNLRENSSATGWKGVRATMKIPTTGKWGFQGTRIGNYAGTASGNAWACLTVVEESWNKSSNPHGTGGDHLSYCGTGWVTNFAGGSNTGNPLDDGDVAEVLLDMDAGTYIFKKNGSTVASGSIGSYSGRLVPALIIYQGSTRSFMMDFGQSGYTPSEPGYNTLSTANMSDPDFVPDLVWIKNRDQADSHALYDRKRGVTLELNSNETAVESTESSGLLNFNQGGFVVGNSHLVNANGEDYAAWMWKEGATPGFDVVEFTGNGGSGTFLHDLGAVPAMMIVKGRAATNNWCVYHKDADATPQNGALLLNSTAAFASSVNYFANAAPSSGAFSVGSNCNSSAGSIAYLWAEVEGFSKFGSYTGNGSANGPFVYTGFKPAWVMWKRVDSADSWVIYDVARNPENEVTGNLRAELANAESADTNGMDFLSNGFKIRTTAARTNTNGATYIYAAFAETPFKYANAR